MSEFFSHPAFLPAILGFLVGGSLAFFFLSHRLSALRAATVTQEKSSAKTISKLKTEVASVHEELDLLRSNESRLMKRQGELEAISGTEQERREATSELLKQTDSTLRHGLIKLENAVLNAVRKSQPAVPAQTTAKKAVAAPQAKKNLPQPSKATPQELSNDDFVPLVQGGKETPREENFEGFVTEEPASKAESAAHVLRAALDSPSIK